MSPDVRLEEIVYPTPELVECPFGFYAKLRSERPVCRLPNGDYLVTRWEDVRHVAHHPDLFSNLIGTATPGFAEALGVDATAVTHGNYSPWPLPFSDPPDHRPKRSLLQTLIRPARLASFEPMIRRLADDLIDGFIDRGAIDFREAFAELLPPMVMLRIFGVPQRDEQMVRTWMSRLLGQGYRHAAPEKQRRHDEGLHNGRSYFRKMILERAAQPDEGFLSDLIAEKLKRDDGELDLEYLVNEVTILYSAAFHNTVFMLSAAMEALLRQPETLARATRDRAVLAAAIEETLRLESPVQWLQRVATADTEIAGVTIPKDSMVLIAWGSANRDGARFDDPDRFDVDRPRVREHLAFGVGVHRCLGEPLARLEAQIGFEQVLARLKHLRLSPGQSFKHVEKVNGRGLEALHIEFERV